MPIIDLLPNITAQALASQQASGAFPAGHNGPYSHPETPVRNTAHWAVTLAWLYSRDADRAWKAALQNAANYLSDREARPQAANFHHRLTAGRDFCNGLIGPAWTFEGLVAAGNALGNERLHELAAEVFLLHPFNDALGLWDRVEVDGSVLGLDTTFNHQLWFAAAGAHITSKHQAEISRRVECFLHRMQDNLVVGKDGLIAHFVGSKMRGRSTPSLGARLRGSAKRLLKRADALAEKERQERLKWAGYHHFNMYAFAGIKERFPSHPFWSSAPFDRAKRLMLKRSFKSELEKPENVYSYGYNAPGFEIPYALEALEIADQATRQRELEYWQQKQLERTYSAASARFERGTTDPETLTARVYEITRLYR